MIDEDDHLVSMARQAHIDQDGGSIDAESWWVSARDCIRSQSTLLREHGRHPMEISAIVVDGTSGSMVLTDSALQPVTRALLYNSGGFHDEAARISRLAPPSHITRGPSSALARALRLAGEDSDACARHLMHQADFIMARLTGQGGHSDRNNCLKTGADPEDGTWPDWIGDTGLAPALLPTPQHAGTAIASISPSVARALGLPLTATIHAGTTDSIAAFLACAEPRPGVAVTSLGTTLAIKAMTEERIDDPDIGLYSHRLGNAWLAGGASNTGGGVLASYFDGGQLEELSSQIDPSDPPGLDFYPLPSAGERFPVNDPDMQPRLEPRPRSDALFLHGLLEGMAHIEAGCYRAIEERGGGFPHTLYTAGGGASNQAWTEIRRSVLGTTLLPARYSEAAIGAARLARRGGIVSP